MMNIKAIRSIKIIKATSGEDIYEISYVTRMGNRAVAEGLATDEQIAELLQYNEKQPAYAQIKVRRI